MASLEEHASKLDFHGLMVTSIIAGLSFVVGLFWRDAINDTIALLVPQGEGVFFKYVAAIVATIIVIVIAFVLVKSQKVRITRIVKDEVKKKLEKNTGNNKK